MKKNVYFCSLLHVPGGQSEFTWINERKQQMNVSCNKLLLPIKQNVTHDPELFQQSHYSSPGCSFHEFILPHRPPVCQITFLLLPFTTGTFLSHEWLCTSIRHIFTIWFQPVLYCSLMLWCQHWKWSRHQFLTFLQIWHFFALLSSPVKTQIFSFLIDNSWCCTRKPHSSLRSTVQYSVLWTYKVWASLMSQDWSQRQFALFES